MQTSGAIADEQERGIEIEGVIGPEGVGASDGGRGSLIDKELQLLQAGTGADGRLAVDVEIEHAGCRHHAQADDGIVQLQAIHRCVDAIGLDTVAPIENDIAIGQATGCGVHSAVAEAEAEDILLRGAARAAAEHIHAQAAIQHVAPIQRVIRKATHKRVVAGTAQQRVVAGAAIKSVVVLAALKAVVAQPSRKDVVVGVALQNIGADISEQGVIALSAEEGVVALAAIDRIPAFAALGTVIAGLELNEIVAVAAIGGIIAGTGVNEIIPGQSLQRVVAGATEQDIGAEEGGRGLESTEGDCEQVGVIAAQHEIIACADVGQVVERCRQQARDSIQQAREQTTDIDPADRDVGQQPVECCRDLRDRGAIAGEDVDRACRPLNGVIAAVAEQQVEVRCRGDRNNRGCVGAGGFDRRLHIVVARVGDQQAECAGGADEGVVEVGAEQAFDVGEPVRTAIAIAAGNPGRKIDIGAGLGQLIGSDVELEQAACRAAGAAVEGVIARSAEQDVQIDIARDQLTAATAE